MKISLHLVLNLVACSSSVLVFCSADEKVPLSDVCEGNDCHFHPVAEPNGSYAPPSSAPTVPAELIVEVYPSEQSLRLIYTALDVQPPPPQEQQATPPDRKQQAGASGALDGDDVGWRDCELSVALDGRSLLGAPLRCYDGDRARAGALPARAHSDEQTDRPKGWRRLRAAAAKTWPVPRVRTCPADACACAMLLALHILPWLIASP